MTGEKLLRIDSVKEKMWLKHAMLYKFMAEGNLPKPIKMMMRCVCWVESEVEAFIQNRIAVSRAGLKRR